MKNYTHKSDEGGNNRYRGHEPHEQSSQFRTPSSTSSFHDLMTVNEAVDSHSDALISLLHPDMKSSETDMNHRKQDLGRTDPFPRAESARFNQRLQTINDV